MVLDLYDVILNCIAICLIVVSLEILWLSGCRVVASWSQYSRPLFFE